MLDRGYYSKEYVKYFYENDINFIFRLKYSFFEDLIQNEQDS